MKLSNRLIFYLYLINIIMYASSFTYFKIEKGIFFINFVLLLLTISITVLKRNAKVCFSDYSIIVIAFTVAFLWYIVLSFLFRKNFEGFVPFGYSLMFCFLISNIKIEEQLLKWLYYLMLIVFLMWIFRIYDYYEYFMIAIYDLKKVNTLNSNLVGMIIMLLTILLCALQERLGIKKCVQIFIGLLGIWGTWNAGTRGSLLALLFFFIFNFVIPKRIFKNCNIMLALYNAIFLLGVIFPIIYVYISKMDISSSAFLNQKSLFSGRELIWNEFFCLLRKNIVSLLFGIGIYNGNDLLYLSADGNSMHNWYLKMIFSFGIIGLVLYYFFIFVLMKKCYKSRVSNVQITLLFGYMAILINSYFENVIGSYVLCCLVYLILMLAFNPIMITKSRSYSNSFLSNVRIHHFTIFVRKKLKIN